MPTPDRTSRAAIVAAARDLLESGGPAGITMQAVAGRVGVRAPSLYKRVRDRDALVTLVARATAEELGARLQACEGTFAVLARTYRAFAHERPEGFRLMFAVDAAAEEMGRASMPVIEAARVLVGEARALDAARLLAAWVTGFVTMELAGAFRFDGDVDRAFEFGLEHLVAGLRP
ncbi:MULTISPECIES: TetR/AcrR family transcriptional regulator [unclassified Nocardiopsis]|uniref:TetR/AcrR family transcriptional regulator n=1 Tax=Nocardiopsis TaxID=2013 RepID=UPI00387B49CE